MRKENCARHCIAGCDAGVVLLGALVVVAVGAAIVVVVVTTSTSNENESEREDKLKLFSSVTQLFYVCMLCVSVCATYFGSTMTSRAFKTQSAVSLHADAIEERIRQRRLVMN